MKTCIFAVTMASATAMAGTAAMAAAAGPHLLKGRLRRARQLPHRLDGWRRWALRHLHLLDYGDGGDDSSPISSTPHNWMALVLSDDD